MTRGVETRLHSWNSWTLAVVFGSEGLATVSLLSLPCAMFCASYGRHLAAHSQGGWKPCLNRGGPGKRRKERLVSWVVPAIPGLVKEGASPAADFSSPLCQSPVPPAASPRDGGVWWLLLQALQGRARRTWKTLPAPACASGGGEP